MIEKLNSMSNKNWLVNLFGNKFVLRKNDSHNNKAVNRDREKEISEIFYKIGLSPKSYFIGNYKISKYLDNSRIFNGSDHDESLLVRSLLKLHNYDCTQYSYDNCYKFNLDRIFSVYYFEFYENRDTSSKSDIYYFKNLMVLLRRVINNYNLYEDICLCHIDLVPENILIKINKAYLIDHEYSALFFKEWDLAGFVLENDYDKFKEERFLDKYNSGSDKKVNLELYEVMKCLVDLLWVEWTYYYIKYNKQEDLKDYLKMRRDRFNNNYNKLILSKGNNYDKYFK